MVRLCIIPVHGTGKEIADVSAASGLSGYKCVCVADGHVVRKVALRCAAVDKTKPPWSIYSLPNLYR